MCPVGLQTRVDVFPGKPDAEIPPDKIDAWLWKEVLIENITEGVGG